MKSYWHKKRVLVTGGAGFIGSYLCKLLLMEGAEVRVTSKSGNLNNIKKIKDQVEVSRVDLANERSAKKTVKRIDIVMHLASKVAGISYNVEHPAIMFRDNVEITKNIFEAARVNNVERFLVVSSACVYARDCSVPTPETEGFINDPEPTNLGYGWAKRVAELFGRLYAQEFGMSVAIARPYNSYGPRDDFNPKTSHVIPGLIKRVYDGENPLVVWGSGKQTRSFLYAEDFARGLMQVTEKYPKADPINIGSDEEVTIANLAKMIVKFSGKNIKIKFDKTKPDGQPRRNCDTQKAKKKVGFGAKTSLYKGLERTIRWYEQRL